MSDLFGTQPAADSRKPSPDAVNAEGKTSLAYASLAAEAIRQHLAEACLSGRCLVAGSVRREKPWVKDIEIVCIPVWANVLTLGTHFEAQTIAGKKLIPATAVKQAYLEKWKNAVWALGGRAKGQVEGGKYLQYSTMLASWLPPEMKEAAAGHMVNIDIFVAEPDTWGNILVIRTGPGDWNREWYFRQLRAVGLKSFEGYLVRQGTRIATPTEETVFDLIQQPFMAPKDRGWPL